ncbi:MAG: YbaN family protein [Phenylobacterium sp.]
MSPDPVNPVPPERPRPGRVAVLVYRGIGVACVGLGTAGLFLPLLPTTVFLLIALWAFARGSPELADRIRADRRFGPMVRDWEERGAIPRRAKALAVGLMTVSLTILWLSTRNVILSAAVAAVLLGVSGYIVTRPSA